MKHVIYTLHILFGRLIVLYNSLGGERREMIRLVVQSVDVGVFDPSGGGHPIPCQVNPVLNAESIIEPGTYEVSLAPFAWASCDELTSPFDRRGNEMRRSMEGHDPRVS